MVCIICEHRPAKGNGYCSSCGSHIEAQSRRKAIRQPKYYLTYRGHVVGLFPNGGDILKAELLRRSPDRLPKGKTINLNVYCQGYSREVIKRFKACMLKLAYA